MPFVNRQHRKVQDLSIPGDRCFGAYKEIMRRWRENPRWTTIDEMLEDMFPEPFKRAYFLAFLVFFNLHGMAYERKKRKQNGDI